MTYVHVGKGKTVLKNSFFLWLTDFRQHFPHFNPQFPYYATLNLFLETNLVYRSICQQINREYYGMATNGVV